VSAIGGSDADSAAAPMGATLPAQAHAASTAPSRPVSSTLLRRLAGNMALLVEVVRAVLPVPEAGSSVLKLVAAKNATAADEL
jgi:hypothetical protein